MNSRNGFTLIEMVISVVIIAILLAIGMPFYRSFILNAQIRTAAESMQAGLNLARNEALRRNALVSLWMVNGVTGACARSSSGTSWVVSFDNPVGACNSAASETTSPRLIQSRAGSDGSVSVGVVALDGAAPPVGSSCITFNGFGRVESACTSGGAPIASITFASTVPSTRTLRVHVESGGATRMCNPAAAAADPAYC